MATVKSKTANKVGRVGNTYVLTALGKKHLENVKGQGEVIRNLISRTALTASQIVDRAGKSLKTKTPAKNVAFYLCTWRADGLVKYGPRPTR